jgi:hypothetical protein
MVTKMVFITQPCTNAFQISAISIAIILRAGRSTVRFPADSTDILFSKTSKHALQLTQPPIHWVRVLFIWG